MAQIIVLGAGLGGLSTAMLLARDGHEVTVLERDPAEPPPAAQAWEAGSGAGSTSSACRTSCCRAGGRRWRSELPEVLDELTAVGGLRLNMSALLPESQRGPMRDERRAVRHRDRPPAGARGGRGGRRRAARPA